MIEHPLIQNIDGLTTEELQAKITDLNKKLMYAHRTGNGFLADQIRLALTTFTNKYQERMRAEWDARTKKTGNDFADKIDIS